MKDLYRRLGYPEITNSIHRERIDALAQQDPNTAQQCRHILLDPKRKVVYDRNCKLMVSIGRIRANLGLTRAANWTSVGYHDFDYPASAEPSEVESLRERLRQDAEAHDRPSVARKIVSTVITIGVILLLSSWIVTYTTNRSLNSPLPSAVQKHPSFREPVQPLPLNGTVVRVDNKSGIAPLRIITPVGDGIHFYVKIVDWYDKHRVVLTLFVRGGHSAVTEVPLGSYELRYAAGTTWYGLGHLFGPETAYSRADKRFEFELVSNQVTGYTVELRLQPHGNLRTHSIDPEDF